MLHGCALRFLLAGLATATAFHATAQEIPPPTVRWLAGDDAPPPPVELRHGDFALTLDGSARRQRLRIELPEPPPLGLLTVELLAATPAGATAPPVPERHEWLPHAGTAAASVALDGTVVVREALVSSAAPLALIRWHADGGFAGLRLRFEPTVGTTVAVTPTALVVTRDTTRLRIELDHVGGSATAEDGTLEVRRPFAVALRIGAPPLPEARSWDALAGAHAAARAARLGEFQLVLAAPETLEATRSETADTRLRALREGASDPDLVATWLELARVRAADRFVATAARPLAAAELATPEAWLDCATPASVDAAPKRPPDLTAAMSQTVRSDGDAALAALRDRFTRDLGRDLLPRSDSRPPLDQLQAAAVVAGLLLHERNGKVHLLPALPRAWPDGRLRHWRTKSGITVDASWRDGRLETGALTPVDGGFVQVTLPQGDYECIPVPAAAPVPWPPAHDGTREFAAMAGRPFVFRRAR